MEKGEKYLTGYIDVGLIGQARVAIFRNNKKEGENSPEWIVTIKDAQENNKQIGVLWEHKKGEV